MGSSDVVGYVWVRPLDLLVYPGGLGSLGCVLGVVGFNRVRPGCRRVHPGSLGSLSCAIGFVTFIRVPPLCSLGSSSFVGFARVRPWGL